MYNYVRWLVSHYLSCCVAALVEFHYLVYFLLLASIDDLFLALLGSLLALKVLDLRFDSLVQSS